ncbi:Lipopolysaccharide-modifying protein [Apiospora kogelbergensis]|uniref:Lipopolysaccharide-modifying protein n=1 Tax=Apiospora kogelbergensis TaxID=1337665 RepID=UPI0031313AEF
MVYKRNRQYVLTLSKKLLVATGERRGRHPPPGFEDWFKAAKKRDAIVIEDFFDRIHHDINPFWALDQLELRRRAHGQPELIRIRNGRVNLVSDDPKRGNRWMQIWTKLVKEIGHLPDLDIPINVMDETRVLVPWEKISEYVEQERRTRHIFPASEAVSTYTGYAGVDFQPGPYDPHWIGGEAHKYWDHWIPQYFEPAILQQLDQGNLPSGAYRGIYL